MDHAPSPPTLFFYTRQDCTLCHEARDALQQVLEDRARRGDPVPRVRYVDVDASDDLRTTYGARVPVLTLDGQELSLASGYRQVAAFVDRILGRLA